MHLEQVSTFQSLLAIAILTTHMTNLAHLTHKPTICANPIRLGSKVTTQEGSYQHSLLEVLHMAGNNAPRPSFLYFDASLSNHPITVHDGKAAKPCK
jgi:hypothetical protein